MTYLEKVQKAKDLIKDAVAKYPKIAIGCSFGKDSMVLLHLARSVDPKIKVFSVMADTEFTETYQFANDICSLWDLDFTNYIFKQIGEGEMCCGKPKVEKSKEAVKDLDAWISGVRRTEGITRGDFKEIEEKDGLVKINPIVDFTELDIWRYTALNQVPINPMYKLGYRSLGCKLCSSPETDENETERSGRWKGTSKSSGECGIHTQSLR